MIRPIKWISFPLAMSYWLVTAIRNYFFQTKVFRSQSVQIPTISVGNLSTGGTGKSPHCDAILHLLQSRNPGLLSRGYGRSSKGFFWVEVDSSPSISGDEPLMLKRRNPTVPTAVCENRVQGAKRMLDENKNLHSLLLDDAFQHRWIARNLDIVLSRWDKPFFKDFILPIGNLREPTSGLKRAKIIVFTYCPENPADELIDAYRKASLQHSSAPILFSRMKSAGIHWISRTKPHPSPKRMLLIAGIAHPDSFVHSFLEENPQVEYRLLKFQDHHNFTEKEILNILSIAKEFDAVVTTEKDLIRLPNSRFDEEKIPLGFLKIEVDWLLHGKELMQNQLDALFTS